MKSKQQEDNSTGVAAFGDCYRADYVYPGNEEKRRLLELRQKGQAPRVLCGWVGNSRVVVLDPALNPEGFTYEGVLNDPTVPPIVQSRFQKYWSTTIAETCDRVAELPHEWEFSVEYHNVYDTGFPVDHGALRRELGPDIAISGGPHIGLFTGGTPEQLFAETKRILLSGIKHGRKFGLREGNNLPPCVPLENLRAVYQGCIEHGCYHQHEQGKADKE